MKLADKDKKGIIEMGDEGESEEVPFVTFTDTRRPIYLRQDSRNPRALTFYMIVIDGIEFHRFREPSLVDAYKHTMNYFSGWPAVKIVIDIPGHPEIEKGDVEENEEEI